MENLKYLKGLSLSILIAVLIFIGCQAVVEDLTGPSALGNNVVIQGIFGERALKIMVQVRQPFEWKYFLAKILQPSVLP